MATSLKNIWEIPYVIDRESLISGQNWFDLSDLFRSKTEIRKTSSRTQVR